MNHDFVLVGEPAAVNFGRHECVGLGYCKKESRFISRLHL